MTIVRADEPGFRQARDALDVGTPIIVAFPTPLPYGVAGLDAGAVNEAKGRPAEQPTGVAVADFDTVTPYLELDEESLAFARWLTAGELLNVLLPVCKDLPDWMLPSTSKGWLAMMLGWLDEFRPLLDERGHLYVSSANRTGGEVTVTAAAANAEFGDELLVLDGDPARDPSVASGSAAIVRVGPRRRVDVVRHGVNNASFAGDTDGYLRALRQRWVTANVAD